MSNLKRTVEIESELYGLFHEIKFIRNGKRFKEYLNFICRFKSYSAFNVSLVYFQKPETIFFATKNHWWREFNREVKEEARPLVILRPGGPVMFVYDVVDTVGEELIPEQITDPFKVMGELNSDILNELINTARDCKIDTRGETDIMQKGGEVQRLVNKLPDDHQRFLIKYNKRQSVEVNFLTIVHELAHVFCGHLGSLDDEKWPDRSEVSRESAEFEAESVGYLICNRLNLKSTSEDYLSGYLDAERRIPKVDVQSVIRSVEWIEKIIKGRKVNLYKKEK